MQSIEKNRDDNVLKETLLRSTRKLKISFECKRPTTPEGETLLANYNPQGLLYGVPSLNLLMTLQKHCKKEILKKLFSELWRKHFMINFLE